MTAILSRPTIQEAPPEDTWSRRTGLLVTDVLFSAGDTRVAELRFAPCHICLTSLRGDGSCRVCSTPDDPVRRVMADARYRLDCFDWQDGYTKEQRAADQATVRQALRILDLRRRDAETPLNGCAECGRLERDHTRVRSHRWDAPTDRLRLARLRARRMCSIP